MAKMAMAALALNEYGPGKALPQKASADAPGEFFARFLKSLPETTHQSPVPATAAVFPPTDKTAATARPRSTMAGMAQHAQPTAPDTDSSDNTGQDALAQGAQNPVALTPSMLNPGTAASVAAPKSSGLLPAKNLCENTKDKTKVTDSDSSASAAPPAPTMLLPQTIPLTAKGPATDSASTEALTVAAPANGQIAAQTADMQAGTTDVDSTSTNDIQDGTLVKTAPPLTIQFPGKTAATEQTTVESDSLFDKTVAIRTNSVVAAPSSDPASQPISATTAPAGQAQPIAAEMQQNSITGLQASANTAMADANRAVALRVSRAIRSGEDTLTIELHPAELGHVAVHIAFHANGVDVQMLVGREETYKAFSQDRAALEQQFSQAGIDLGTGGLDLRHSQTPSPQPKQSWASASAQSVNEPEEAQARTVFLGENLVNIVA